MEKSTQNQHGHGFLFNTQCNDIRWAAAPLIQERLLTSRNFIDLSTLFGN